MDSLIFAFEAVAPIIAMVAIGYILKRLGLMDQSFAKKANKLVFRLFLPVMLFLNVYGIEDIQVMAFGYIGFVVAVVLIVFFAAVPLVMLVTKKQERRGALLQGTFRSNYALIGIPLAQSLFGQEGSWSRLCFRRW